MGLLLTLFESKTHIIIIFHLKTNRQKLEKYHVNGSQARILVVSAFEKILAFSSISDKLILAVFCGFFVDFFIKLILAVSSFEKLILAVSSF